MMNGQVDLGGSLVLIDTQWNVNLKRKAERKRNNCVLIDTQWNVNYCLDHFPEVFKIVLIDTQWNVNLNP